VVTDPEHWLEPGIRWRVNEDNTEEGSRFAARFWPEPGESTEVVITLEPSETGGTDVTIHETRDRAFGLVGRATAQLVGAS